MLVELQTSTKRVKISSVKKKDIDKLIKAVKKHDIIEEVIIFGSSAKGTAEESSDIDICFITSMNDYTFCKEVVSVIYNDLAELKFKSKIDILIYSSRAELVSIADESDSFSVEKDILIDGITVYERSSRVE